MKRLAITAKPLIIESIIVGNFYLHFLHVLTTTNRLAYTDCYPICESTRSIVRNTITPTIAAPPMLFSLLPPVRLKNLFHTHTEEPIAHNKAIITLLIVLIVTKSWSVPTKKSEV